MEFKSNGRPPMLHVAGLWEKTDKNGRKYFVGALGHLRVFIFQNAEKKGENSPDLFLSLGQRAANHESKGGGSSENGE